MKRNHSDSVIGRDLLYTFFYSNRQHSLTVLPQEDYNFTTDLICFQYQNQKRSFGITKGGKGEGVTKKFSSDVNLYLCSLRLCPSKLQADYKVKKKNGRISSELSWLKLFLYILSKTFLKCLDLSGHQKERTPSLVLTIELNQTSSFPTNGWSTATCRPKDLTS